MRVLAPHDMHEVLTALHVVGEAESIVDYAERVCRELLRLVPGVSASYNEVNLPALRVSALVHPDPGREWFDQYLGIFEANLRDSPIVQHFAVTGENDIVTWADLDPEGTFFRSVLYREFYAPNGIHSQIAFLLPAPSGRRGLHRSRTGPAGRTATAPGQHLPAGQPRRGESAPRRCPRRRRLVGGARRRQRYGAGVQPRG
jgi:hypothetical protein